MLAPPRNQCRDILRMHPIRPARSDARWQVECLRRVAAGETLAIDEFVGKDNWRERAVTENLASPMLAGVPFEDSLHLRPHRFGSARLFLSLFSFSFVFSSPAPPPPPFPPLFLPMPPEARRLTVIVAPSLSQRGHEVDDEPCSYRELCFWATWWRYGTAMMLRTHRLANSPAQGCVWQREGRLRVLFLLTLLSLVVYIPSAIANIHGLLLLARLCNQRPQGNRRASGRNDALVYGRNCDAGLAHQRSQHPLRLYRLGGAKTNRLLGRGGSEHRSFGFGLEFDQ